MSVPPESPTAQKPAQADAPQSDPVCETDSAKEAFAAEERALRLKKEQEQRLHRKVGGVFIALLLLLVLLFSVDNLTDFFEKNAFLVESYYNDIGDLKPGAPVYLGGVQIGKVASYELGEDGRVRVRAALHLRKPVPVDSQMNIDATTVSGDTFISLVRGESKELIEPKKGGTIPVLRGTGFFNVSDIGVLAADIGALAAGLGKNFGMFRNPDSKFSKNLRELKEKGALVKEEYELFMQRLRKTKGLVEAASKSFNKTSVQVAGLDVRLDVGGLPKKADELKQTLSAAAADYEKLSPVIDQAKKEMPGLMAQWKELGRKAGSIEVRPHSVAGALTTQQCEGIAATAGLFRDAVAKVSDYSLLKKLKYYFNAKDLYESFEKQTPLTLQLDAHELYRSWQQFMRTRKATMLPRYPTACPLPAELR